MAEPMKDENIVISKKAGENYLHLLASVVISSYDAIITKTSEGVITSWNQGAERIYGYSAEEAVDKPISFLLPLGHKV